MSGQNTDIKKLIPALGYKVTVPEDDVERFSKSVRFDIDIVPFDYAWYFPKKIICIGSFDHKKRKLI